MIELRDVFKSYAMGDAVVHALRGVSLRIEDGDFVAIMGPSGSGKSTLAHVIGLLDAPTSGSYRINGAETSGLSESEVATVRRDQIGFVFQQFNLLPRMSAEENVALPLFYSDSKDPRAGGTRMAERHRRAQRLLEMVGLGPRADHRPNELSGGQQQRVAIARALINHPRMILADEPTGNLDSASEVEILRILRELNAQGITIVMVTHEEEVAAKAKRLIRMRDGRVLSDERIAPVDAPEMEPASPPPELETGRATARATVDLILEHFGQGFRTLAANKARTFLSVLGILIGVAAVVAMLALGRGAQASIEAQLATLGSNLLVLRPGALRIGGVTQDAAATTRLTMEDAEAIVEKVPEIKTASATVNGRAQVGFKDKNWSTFILGAGSPYADIHALQPEIGRFFTEDENRRRARVVVIGMTIVRELFGTENPIGENVKINKVNFQVIGILPEKGNNGWRDQDDYLIVPVWTAMRRLLGKRFVDSIDLEMRSGDGAEAAEKSITTLLYARKRVPPSAGDDAFQIHNMADIQEALTESSRTMSTLLAAVAAISLLVGGIGIMNIMLVSVTERTKEIGLRKAIGAKRGDILIQFLVESVAVSLVGGTAGIAVGWAITALLAMVAGWATSISVTATSLAFCFSAGIGVVFGIYPARRASKLHPIDALRYE